MNVSDGLSTLKDRIECHYEYYQKIDDNIAKAISARDVEVARIQGLSKT